MGGRFRSLDRLEQSIRRSGQSLFFPSSQRRDFSDDRGIFANSTRPSGRAVVVDGGFNVSGRWSLVSGCELADWIPVMCVVQNADQPRDTRRWRAQDEDGLLAEGLVRILDTWHVGGLRGTGSHDIIADDIFVPAGRTFSFSDSAQNDRPLARMPFFATVCAGCARTLSGSCAGGTRHLLELASSKVQVDQVPATRDRPWVQTLVASSGPELAAARLLLYSALADVWAACTQRVTVTDTQRAQLWESGHHAAHVSREVVRSMYDLAGASALYIGCPLSEPTAISMQSCSTSSSHHFGWRPPVRSDSASHPEIRFSDTQGPNS